MFRKKISYFKDLYKKTIDEKFQRKYDALLKAIGFEIAMNYKTSITIVEDDENILTKLKEEGFVVNSISNNKHEISGWGNDNKTADENII